MNKDLVKQAFMIGYRHGLEKRAEGEYIGDAEFPDRGGTRALGNDFLERLGRTATVAEATGAGALLGSAKVNSLLGRIGLRGIRGKGRGALVGAGIGMLANTLGGMRAALSKGRTSQDQVDYDKGLRFKNVFMPGAGAYNHAKRKEREKITQWHG